MTEPIQTAPDDVDDGDAPDAEAEAEDPGSKPSPRKLVLIGAGAALVAIVVAAQRDIATQPDLRGPRWFWHAVASTPPGVVLYGLFGPRGPEFGDLPPATIRVVTPET